MVLFHLGEGQAFEANSGSRRNLAMRLQPEFLTCYFDLGINISLFRLDGALSFLNRLITRDLAALVWALASKNMIRDLSNLSNGHPVNPPGASRLLSSPPGIYQTSDVAASTRIRMP
jgi:hypothetical protein